MKFQWVVQISAIVSLALIAPAATADPVLDLEECYSISVETERQACLEAGQDQLRAAGMTTDSILKSSLPKAEASPATADGKSEGILKGWTAKERKLFGMRVPFTGQTEDREALARSKDGIVRQEDGSIKSISSAVAAVSTGGRGKLTVTLENGQKWRQKDGRIKAKVGDKVIIRTAALGSYFMTVGKGRAVRAVRVDGGSATTIAAATDTSKPEAPDVASEPETKEGLFSRFGRLFGGQEIDVTEADFGKTPADRAKEHEDDPASMTQIVVSSMVNPYDEFIITLENGQVWQQIDGRLKVREGDSVTIDRNGIGTHFLQVDNKGRSVRVKRVD